MEPRGTPALRYKRPLDLALAALLAVVSAPLAALIALAVKLTSPGPIIFRQERLGQHGRPFTLYKFRTMYDGVDCAPHRAYFQQYKLGAPAPDQERAIYKLRRDPRITPVGGILRRLGIDELPQLYNVLRGDMTLVGPRPPLAYEVAEYSPYHRQRLQVKPGLTGFWQIRGRDVVDFETMVAMDLEYIARQSLAVDLGVLLLTVPAVLASVMRE